METIEGLTENAMSFEESLKQISPSDKNQKPIVTGKQRGGKLARKDCKSRQQEQTC